jgi:hypothetical protein
VPIVSQIVKYRNPEAVGMMYTAQVDVPRCAFGIRISVTCIEAGTTGVRETALLMRDGAAALQQMIRQRQAGTALGPFDPGFEPDKEEHNAQFPDHPVVRVRRRLRSIEGSLHLGSLMRSEPPAEGTFHT